MYARITNYKLRPEHHNDETEELMRTRLPGQVDHIAGLRNVYWLTRPGDHSAMVIALYDSGEAARAAAGQIQQVWESWMHVIDGRPHTETYDVVARVDR